MRRSGTVRALTRLSVPHSFRYPPPSSPPPPALTRAVSLCSSGLVLDEWGVPLQFSWGTPLTASHYNIPNPPTPQTAPPPKKKNPSVEIPRGWSQLAGANKLITQPSCKGGLGGTHAFIYCSCRVIALSALSRWIITGGGGVHLIKILTDDPVLPPERRERPPSRRQTPPSRRQTQASGCQPWPCSSGSAPSGSARQRALSLVYYNRKEQVNDRLHCRDIISKFRGPGRCACAKSSACHPIALLSSSNILWAGSAHLC